MRAITGGDARPVSVSELAHFLECDLEAVVEGLHAAAAHEALLLEMPPFTTTAVAGLQDEERAEHQLEQFIDPARIFACAQDLSRRERVVLYMRFQDGRSHADIAKRIGVSETDVSRLIGDALPRLRAREHDFAAA
jgi:RNA polymerase sigma-B factor